MSRAQWILIFTLAASFYDAGTIWMTQFGWRLWPYVAPADFAVYHDAWWSMIKPVIFPVAALAFIGSILLIWWRPDGVEGSLVWINAGMQLAVYILTAIFWGPWQAQTHYARLPDGSLDPVYQRVMSTHWIRAALISANAVLVLWMMIQHLSHRGRGNVS